MRKLTKEAELELHELKDGSGLLFEEAVVARAKSKDSALHAYFRWDITGDEAKEQFWLDQARQIIKLVRFTVVTPEPGIHKIAHFQSLGGDRVRGGGYRAMTDIEQDPEHRADLLRTALSELGGLQRRYRVLSAELGDVFAAIEAAQENAAATQDPTSAAG